MSTETGSHEEPEELRTLTCSNVCSIKGRGMEEDQCATNAASFLSSELDSAAATDAEAKLVLYNSYLIVSVNSK